MHGKGVIGLLLAFYWTLWFKLKAEFSRVIWICRRDWWFWHYFKNYADTSFQSDECRVVQINTYQQAAKSRDFSQSCDTPD